MSTNFYVDNQFFAVRFNVGASKVRVQLEVTEKEAEDLYDKKVYDTQGHYYGTVEQFVKLYKDVSFDNAKRQNALAREFEAHGNKQAAAYARKCRDRAKEITRQVVHVAHNAWR